MSIILMILLSMNHDAAADEPFFKYYKYITYPLIFKSLYYIIN